MELTTHLELQSQATRLEEQAPYTAGSEAQTGLSPSMICHPRQIILGPLLATSSTLYNSHTRKPNGDLQSELFPLHSPLLGESLLVSFPPLSYMLKSSGSSYLISGPVVKVGVEQLNASTYVHPDELCCYYSILEYSTAWGYWSHNENYHTMQLNRGEYLLNSLAHVSKLQVTQSLQLWYSSVHINFIQDKVSEGCYRHWNKHAPRNTRKRNVRSKIWWFTEFCNSHYVSHFAAFFIVARAKISIVESYSFVMVLVQPVLPSCSRFQIRRVYIGWNKSASLNIFIPKQLSKAAQRSPFKPAHDAAHTCNTMV